MISTVDAVVLRAGHDGLELLLWQRPADANAFPGVWALPGGWVFEDQDADLAATVTRLLATKVGFTPDYLEQVETIGSRDRDPRGWSMTVLHLALVRQSASRVSRPDICWRPVAALRANPQLPFDHDLLLAKALTRLAARASYSTLPLYLAEHELKLPELQRIYELALGNPLHKRAFRDRLLASGVLEDTGQRVHGRGSPAVIYRYRANQPVCMFDRVMQGATGDRDDD